MWIGVLCLSVVACTSGEPSELPLGDGGVDDGSVDAATDGTVEDATTDACKMATWCRDADGDGFGDPDDCVEVCWAEVVEGYVFDNDQDCYDDNADAKPGQTAFFEEDRGDGSFDYDCDGEEELWRPTLAVCATEETSFEPGWLCVCSLGTPDNCLEWAGCEIPGCGDSAKWDYMGCSLQHATDATQRCR